MLSAAALAVLLFGSDVLAKGGWNRPSGPHPTRCRKHNVCEETPLITPAELANMIGGPNPPILLDVYWGDKTATGPNPLFPDAKCTRTDLNSGPNRVSYTEAHVARAFPVDWRCDLSTANFLYDLPERAQFEEFVDKHDIEDLDTPLVFYDRNPAYNRMAIRGAFVFEYYGYTNIKVVDGGLEKIIADAVGISIVPGAGPALPDPLATGNNANLEEQPQLLTDAVFVGENLDNDFVQLIDARPIHHYVGFNYPGMGALDSAGVPLVDFAPTSGSAIHTGIDNVRNGHIPGCYNRAWADNYNWWKIAANDVAGAASAGFVTGEELQFVTVKSATDLAALYSRFMDTQKTVVTICNEGIHAVLDRFMLEKILCREALVYEGSHTEWTALPFDPTESDRSTPVTTGCEYGGSECPSTRPLSDLSVRSTYTP